MAGTGISDPIQAASPDSSIVYFGDSLGDSGEFWRLSSLILVDPLPAPEYYAHQFSNGEVKTDILTRLLGYDHEYNYAVGGARAIGPLTAADFVTDEYALRPDLDPSLLSTRIDLSAQSDRFLADAATQGWDLSGFTAQILIGINDLSNWEPQSIWPWRWDNEIHDLLDRIVITIGSNVQKLLDAGVGTVWVETQPEETFFPVYAELDWLTRLLGRGVIDELNAGLAQMVQGLGDDRVHILDLNMMTDEIEANPLNFGRLDLENSILLGKASSYDPQLNPALPADFDFATDANDYGFIDYVHPTEGTHRVLAAFEAEAMRSTLIGGGNDCELIAGTRGDDLVLASGGNDTVRVGNGDDVAIGGTGDDTIYGAAGSDLVSGGAGNDFVHGGDGNDLLTGGYGDDTVVGVWGDDVLIDTAGSDMLAGGQGDDWILWFDNPPGGTQGPDTVLGGAGSDTLILYLSDTETYDGVLAELAALTGGRYAFSSVPVTIENVETIRAFDLSVQPLELPDTGVPDLAARMDEWQHWDFA